MTSEKNHSQLLKEFDLNQARQDARIRIPAVHQSQALSALSKWHAKTDSPKGGILVLPTGGGKTFTAVNFTCHESLSRGSKVLWLAHTHHLLEQAFESFEKGVGLISEPRASIRVRVVSGLGGDHFPVHSIKPTDDVVIMSLAAACRASESQHPAFDAFLKSSNGDLLVIFDEAHHAPAPTYRDLLRRLRLQLPRMQSLGLTATPTHSDERKRGWLLELFPQGIIYEVTANQLMQQGVLAKPVFHDERTKFSPEFSERDYKKWLGTNADLPEGIISTLAESRDRNSYIIETYVHNQTKWGKTIIFADRWFQCEYLREGLSSRGVRVDVVYNHTGPTGATTEERNRRTADDNSRVLKEFKAGNLDVLINVKMLTEGTDVPDVQTVFITRQTTSRILLTQMIGRALRGPKFGGTEEANIVFFVDDWKHRIDWATSNVLIPGPLIEELRELRKRPPVDLISIELVRRLARQMDDGDNQNILPFCQYLPIGWYVTDVMTNIEGTDDDQQVRHQVMVFEKTQSCFIAFFNYLSSQSLHDFKKYELRIDEVDSLLSKWIEEFFADVRQFIVGDLRRDLFFFARHVAQNDLQRPLYVPFDEHKHHDLDAVARDHHDADIGIREVGNRLQKEYARKDRRWNVFYPTYGWFKSQYDGCINRIGAAVAEITKPSGRTLESTPDREATEEVKLLVKRRDGKQCLCCGKTRRLQIDHIDSFYLGGPNDTENLQTLCSKCNQAKKTTRMDFRSLLSPMKEADRSFVEYAFPSLECIRSTDEWQTYIRARINLYYRCAAVEDVVIGQRGTHFYEWKVRLRPENDPAFLKQHINYWVQQIREYRHENGLTPAPETIDVSSMEP